jgi:AmmeMemoRadiSam system protein B/AmmeMemoRadiSam system protein A
VRLWGQPAGQHDGIREPAVAGRFYPGRADRLAEGVDRYVSDAREEMAGRTSRPAGRGGAVAGPPSPGDGRLVAVVVPHAGHVYSGPTAGFGYASIDPRLVQRVVLLGPAHYVPVDGIGLSTATAWRTPLGDVPLDQDLAEDLRARIDTVIPADDAHAPEHSLEVQVPFLQRVLADRWVLCPLIVGADLPGDLAAVITLCAGLPGTLVVVSTDLSHYLDYSSAVAQDARTIRSIVQRRPDSIGVSDACGRHPLRGLLAAAAAQDWGVRLLDARNSGDTAGDRDRVVGYAAFAVRAAEVSTSPAASARGAARSAAAPSPAPPDPTAARSGREGPGPDAGSRSAPRPARIGAESRAVLLRVARGTIEEALSTQRRPSFDADRWPAPDPVLREPGAAFVTLRSPGGDLLGCIGSLAPRQPLIDDVAEHAFDAAFRDPRFPPMTPGRAHGMVIDISVLSPTRPFPCVGYRDLLERVPVGTGLVVSAGRHHATFLPAVWEQLPEPAAFLAALWRKAGLAPGQWPEGTMVEVYDCEEFAEA